MGKKLVIVESPAKSKTITKYLGKDFSVKATMGHIIDLPERELGVDIDNGFVPKYKTVKGKKSIIKALKDAAAGADEVFLATDPDREGEAIAWHAAEAISQKNTTVKRIQFNEITKSAVNEAIKNPHEINNNLVNAQQTRRILDRIVGYLISPILWRTVFKGLSAGRVQSVALRIICEREDEINAFKQEEYWSVIGKFIYEDYTVNSKLKSIKGKKPVLPDKDTTHNYIKEIKKQDYTVSSVEKKSKKRRPYPPFITSSMQQDAARRLNFSAAKTMRVAQQLYEGLELGSYGTMGLITYMRTDSTRVADEAVSNVRRIIPDMFGKKYLSSSPRKYGKSKNSQDAHEAIRPSQIAKDFSPDAIKSFLSRDQYRLYDLIWKRFLASQMAEAVIDQTSVDIKGGDYIFRATGSIMRFSGFLTLYNDVKEESKSGENEGRNNELPDIKENISVTVDNIEGKQHFTQPPPRYTEASLVKELEAKGIGRPSTYAQIIDTLKKREYVIVDKKRFQPSEIGQMVKSILVTEFPHLFDVGFTAGMENDLDSIEEGEAASTQVLESFYTPLKERLDHVKQNIKEIRARNQEVTDRTCPECKEEKLVVKWSKNGRFYACRGFPKCRYTPYRRSLF